MKENFLARLIHAKMNKVDTQLAEVYKTWMETDHEDVPSAFEDPNFKKCKKLRNKWSRYYCLYLRVV